MVRFTCQHQQFILHRMPRNLPMKSVIDSKTMCYPSECKIGFGFDDSSGQCSPCKVGCGYCVKALNEIICKKCFTNYAQKLDKNGKILDCLLCNFENCKHCEVKNDGLTCFA